MQHQKCSLEVYTNFLIANQNRYSGVGLSKNMPTLSHDHITRWLAHGKYTPGDLWKHVQPLVSEEQGYLVGDDSLLSKRFSRENELAKFQYSGNAHGLQNGICLVNLLWTNGDAYLPVDYRIYQKENDDKTKNDHFQDMLKKAKKRGFKPYYCLMDSWYGSVENLKLITKELNMPLEPFRSRRTFSLRSSRLLNWKVRESENKYRGMNRKRSSVGQLQRGIYYKVRKS